MNLNATHKTSVRMQENDVSSSCKNEHPINTISYASPFDINHNLKKHELQNEHDPLKRSLPKKNYENREPFDFTNLFEPQRHLPPFFITIQQIMKTMKFHLYLVQRPSHTTMKRNMASRILSRHHFQILSPFQRLT